MGRVAAEIEFAATDYMTSHICPLYPAVRTNEAHPDGWRAIAYGQWRARFQSILSAPWGGEVGVRSAPGEVGLFVQGHGPDSVPQTDTGAADRTPTSPWPSPRRPKFMGAERKFWSDLILLSHIRLACHGGTALGSDARQLGKILCR